MISDVPGTEHMGRAGVELTTGRRWTALILLVMRRSPVRFREAAPRPEAHSDHGRGLCASAVAVYVCPVFGGLLGFLRWLTRAYCRVWLAGCEYVRSVMTRAIT